MASLYSVRFILAPPGQLSYVVPAGQVAVVRSVQMFNTDGAVAGWGIFGFVGGAQLAGATLGAWARVAGELHSVNLDMRVVAREGEQIGFSRSGAAVHCTASGYLFR
jgi:hypothetical protein